MSGQILVLSGPSGSGKSTLLSRILKDENDLYFSISSTTRAPRDGEKNGVNYHFINENEFMQGIKDGDFLEWARVHNNYYGTSLKPVLNAVKMGKIAIFDIDVQGFHIARSKFSELITSVFITTPNCAELERRLKNRNTDSDEIIRDRLKNAREEMTHIKSYDYVLINDDLERSYENLRAILRTMRLKSAHLEISKIIKNW